MLAGGEVWHNTVPGISRGSNRRRRPIEVED